MSDARMPNVSVLLPVFNAERYLREAVGSILTQTFADFELLAIDDGSTDGSLAILREFEKRDTRVRAWSRENRGLVATLNELIGKARGRYLARMDADDICRPYRFEKQVAFLDQHPDHVLVGGWVERMTVDGKPIGNYPGPCAHEEIDALHLKAHTSISHPVAMLHRDAVLSAGGYRSEFLYAEDLDLWLRLAEIGRIANLPEVVLSYRLHSNSLSESQGAAQQDAMMRACGSAHERRGSELQYVVSKHWRPTGDSRSRHEFALQYGWVAWNHGYRSTWWSFVGEVMWLRPFSLSSWKLLVFGALRSPQRRPCR